MFLAAGNVLLAAGHDRIADLRGLASGLPVTVFAFGLAGVSLVGLPPTGGFVAKFLLLDASITQGAWWWTAVLAAGSLLAAAYVLALVGVALRERDDGAPALRRVPMLLQSVPLVLAVAALAVGCVPGPVLDLLAIR
jgi:multicomponent Na+:H+ antiporter subunit D